MATTFFLLVWTLVSQSQPATVSAPSNPVAAQAHAAQVPAIPDLPTPKDARERIELAARNNGLAGLSVPWHLKATYQLFGSGAAATETGTYEEWWVSDQQYRVALNSANGSREEFGTDHGTFVTNPTGWGRGVVDSIKHSVERPIRMPEDLKKYRLTNYEEKNGTVKVPCTGVVGPGFGAVPDDSYCFAPSNAILIYSSEGSQNMFQTTFARFASARGQTFARDIQTLLVGQLWLKLHIDSVEGIAPHGMDALQVPANATPSPVRTISPGMRSPVVQRGADPVLPPDAKRKGIHGTVFVGGIVGTDGHVSELEAFGGPEALHKAALECVQTWLFTPAVYEGKPVPVTIQVEVNFRAP